MANTKSVFGSIKERLGLDAQAQTDAYDEYDEFEDYEEDFGEYEDDDPGYSTRSTRSSRSSFSSIGLPHLVSRADAEESTRSRSIPLPSSSSSRSTGRTMVDSSLPPTMTPEGTAAVSAAGNRRSEGLDSLFSSTASSRSQGSSLPVIGAAAGAASIAGKRKLQVIRPASYEDAEGVTDALKAGDVAVLVLGGVQEGLMHRLLDFSFGAASALGAAVECVAPKVFVIYRGDSLTDMERVNLQTMGVL